MSTLPPGFQMLLRPRRPFCGRGRSGPGVGDPRGWGWGLLGLLCGLRGVKGACARRAAAVPGRGRNPPAATRGPVPPTTRSAQTRLRVAPRM